MTAVKTKTGLQFSLRTLMVIITVACVVLALPRGYVLLAVGVVWALVAAAVTWVLMLCRRPIYHVVSGVKLDEADK
jgi:hypothetical protein